MSVGVTINAIDVAGLGLAAVKGLAKKVERLERGGGSGGLDLAEAT